MSLEIRRSTNFFRNQPRSVNQVSSTFVQKKKKKSPQRSYIKIPLPSLLKPILCLSTSQTLNLLSLSLSIKTKKEKPFALSTMARSTNAVLVLMAALLVASTRAQSPTSSPTKSPAASPSSTTTSAAPSPSSPPPKAASSPSPSSTPPKAAAPSPSTTSPAASEPTADSPPSPPSSSSVISPSSREAPAPGPSSAALNRFAVTRSVAAGVFAAILDQGEEFGVDYTPPSTHPPVQPPPILMHNSDDEDDEFRVDYAPPRTHPPRQPPPMHNSGGEDEIGSTGTPKYFLHNLQINPLRFGRSKKFLRNQRRSVNQVSSTFLY
ncbi:vegetative cell wall protein gp1-like [Prunus persica]|uniref:vegetative cell wall protein gp1-like n=1 Tax=Prunus persica TaxID=3760 RepID=UPI0009AB9A5B|nr:vegetative cell wall protein gp1-like [Prunus persica]